MRHRPSTRPDGRPESVRVMALRRLHGQRRPVRGLGLAGACLLLAVVALSASGLGASQTSSPFGTPSSSPAASPSPAFNVEPATPTATPQAVGALGRTDSDNEQRSQPIRPSGRITVDGGPLRGNKIRRPTLANRSVYDPYRLLDADQRSTLRADADRLRRVGLPTLVYVRISEANDVQAAAFADRLLDEWNVESAPGANDGMVLLISMGVSTRRSGEVIVRTGGRALPQGGLTEARLAEIVDERIAPRVKRGQIYTGALSGLRGMVYTIAYYPEPQAPLTSWQQRVHDTLIALAPALGGLALLSMIGRLFRTPRFLAADRPVGRLVPFFVLTCSLLLALLAVYARSRVGIAIAVALFLLLIALPPLNRRLDTRRSGSSPNRTVTVGPWHDRGQALAAHAKQANVAAPAHRNLVGRRAGLSGRVEQRRG